MDRVVRFCAKIGLGPSDSHIRLCLITFYNIGWNKKTDPIRSIESKNLKFGIGSQKNLPYFEVTMWWYRVDVPILSSCPVPGCDLPKYLVPVSMLYQYWYQLRYRRPYRYRRFRYLMSYRTYQRVRYRYWCCIELNEVSGTGIDVVPNSPKCSVPVPVPTEPVSMSYRTYRSVRDRYCCRTERTEVSGTGSDWYRAYRSVRYR